MPLSGKISIANFETFCKWVDAHNVQEKCCNNQILFRQVVDRHKVLFGVHFHRRSQLEPHRFFHRFVGCRFVNDVLHRGSRNLIPIFSKKSERIKPA